MQFVYFISFKLNALDIRARVSLLLFVDIEFVWTVRFHVVSFLTFLFTLFTNASFRKMFGVVTVNRNKKTAWKL